MLNCYLKRCILGIVLLVAGTGAVNAQSTSGGTVPTDSAAFQKQLQGTVLDEFGKPLPSTRITTQDGKWLGTTNDDGSFTIPLPAKNETIILNHSGYNSKVIKNNSARHLTIQMDESYLKNPEKVEVLYDVKDSKEILGAVSSVYNRQLTTTPTSLYLNALTGRLPGFYTQQASGFGSARTTPITANDLAGSLPNDATKYSSSNSDNTEMYFNLRGQTPVTMIDGVQRDIYSIDPEDIESVTVLKDALSTLLLGQKSSRGVLQVTTKKGVAGPPRISFTAESGVQSALKTPTPLTAYQYAYLYNEALQNEGKPTAYSGQDFAAFRNGSSPFMYPDVNWYNTILKDNNPTSNYNLSVNGGLKNARYAVSLSYFNQQGMFQSSDAVDYETNLELNRYLINTSVDVDVTKDFTIGLQVFGRIQDGRQPGAGTSTLLNRLYTTPNNVYPVFNSDGSYGGSADYTTNLYSQTVGSGYLLDNTRDLMANLDLKYKFDNWLPGLYAKAKINASSTSSSLINRNRQDPVYDLSLNLQGDTVYTRYGSVSNQQNSFSMTSTVQFFYAQAAIGYDSKIGNNNFGAMIFADQQISTYQFDLPEKYTNIAATVNYNYNHKYFAEGAVNYAGFDRFEPGHQFGLFYAGGLGWDIAQESFIKSKVNWIDQLKLRATYGKTGNTNEPALGYFPWRWAFGQDGTNSYPSGPTYAPVWGLAEKGLANINATWEKAHKFNAGLDMSFLGNHFNVTADYYHDVYYDLLEQRGSTIELIGLNYPNENIGKNLYEGQELSLTYRNHINNFNYFITANASRMRTEVLYMDEVAQQYEWNKRTGIPVGQTFGYLADGLIQTQEEADQAATFAGVTVHPGDVKLVDLNKDGVIDQFDQTALGNTKPIIYYGTTLGFNLAGFDCSVLLQGVKNRTYQQTDYSFGSGGKEQGYDYLLGRWTPETATTATYPRLTIGFNANNTPYLNNSSYWTRSGEYFRIKNINIGYTFPYHLTNKLKISGLRIFASAQNLFTTTPYDRLDPEIYSSTAYPMQKIISAGINIKL